MSFMFFGQDINYEVTGFKIRMMTNERWTEWTEFTESDGFIKMDLTDSIISLKFKVHDEYSKAFYSILNHEIEIIDNDIVNHYSCQNVNNEDINILFSYKNKCIMISEEEFQAIYTYE